MEIRCGSPISQWLGWGAAPGCEPPGETSAMPDSFSPTTIARGWDCHQGGSSPPFPPAGQAPSAWTPTSPGANSPILNQNPGTGLLPSGISIFPVKLAEILPPEMWRIGAHRKSAPGRPATPWGDSGLLWQPKPGGGKRHAWAWWGGNGALVNGRSRNPDRLHRKTPPPSSPPGAVESLGGTLMPGPGGHFAAFCRPPLGPRV